MEEPQFNRFTRLQKVALDEAREQAIAAKDVLALIWLDQFEALVLDENGEINRAIEQWVWQAFDPFNEAPAHLRPVST